MNEHVAVTQTETYQAVADRLTTTWPEGTPEVKKGARIARRLLWICRQANWVPETAVASHQAVTEFFDRNTPATFGVTPGTYAVYRSEALSVLKPDPVRKGRYILQMTGVYREVHDRTVDSGMPPQFRWRCSPLLWYLHDRALAPPDITDNTLMEYYLFSLDVEQLPEERARRQAKDAARYISHLAGDPDFAEFGFSPVEITFPNRSIKYDVPRDIADSHDIRAATVYRNGLLLTVAAALPLRRRALASLDLATSFRLEERPVICVVIRMRVFV